MRTATEACGTARTATASTRPPRQRGPSVDDIDALEQLARRMGSAQLTALVTRIALRAAAWPEEMAGNQARGGLVKGDWKSPHWDMQLVLALRLCASEIEGRWAASEERRRSWNQSLEEQFHARYHRGFLYDLGPGPEGP